MFLKQMIGPLFLDKKKIVFICCFALKVDPASLARGASQAVLAVIAPIWGLRKFALKP